MKKSFKLFLAAAFLVTEFFVIALPMLTTSANFERAYYHGTGFASGDSYGSATHRGQWSGPKNNPYPQRTGDGYCC